MSSDTLKLSATQISELPLPERTFEWNQGAEYAQLAYLAESEPLWASYLHMLGQETAKAYEIDNDVFEWWLNRLPVWR